MRIRLNKSIAVFLFILVANTIVFSQNSDNSVDIVYFSGLEDAEVTQLNELASFLKRKIDTIFIKNAYDPVLKFEWVGNKSVKNVSGVEDWKGRSVTAEPEKLKRSIKNLSVKNHQELESLAEYYDKLLIIKTEDYWYENDSLPVKVVWDKDEFEKPKKAARKVAKRIKKEIGNDSKKIAIVFENAATPYFRSFESFSSSYQASTNPAEFRVTFSKDCNYTETLKPQGDLYTLGFEGGEYFESYEVELYEVINGHAEFVNSEILYLNNHLTDFGWRLTSGRRKSSASLFLDYNMLGEGCVTRARKRGEDVESNDEECSTCAYDCLYGKRYGIRIRGYFEDKGFAEGVYEELWSCFLNVLFQCEK